MNNNTFAIIEIGSSNTKTHIFENETVIYENNQTIEFKKNYSILQKINEEDIEKLCLEIKEAKKYTEQIFIFGCSIFRNISEGELKNINELLTNKYNLNIKVVSQNDEALLTGYGCYSDIEYDGNICIFIGGGGSTELLFVNNKKIIDQKYFDFGVVDITNQFKSLKEDYCSSSFDEVYSYISSLIGDINIQCDLLILAGGNHLYWYNSAKYQLKKNHLYQNEKQKYLISIDESDKYDKNALERSLDLIRANSDNPLWFDGSRAMKVITNVISHKINAKYIIPTEINMEDGLRKKIINDQYESE
ncbi:MAG: hypothetical protein PHN42_02725 [Bacilli bacterium]|nr:hypothetical protein [Bacilli bacterium]